MLPAWGRLVSVGAPAAHSRTAHKALTNPDLPDGEGRDLHCISTTLLPPGLRALIKKPGERERERAAEMCTQTRAQIL